MYNELLKQLFELIPTVAATAVIIKVAVSWLKAQGWVSDGQALLWQSALNATAYLVLYLSGQYGYATQVDEAIAWLNANINSLAALAGLLALTGTSIASTKLFHEFVKWLQGKLAKV